MEAIYEEIKRLKKELVDKYGINSDRELIKQLGIKQEDIKKLFLWIEYQGFYKYRDGYSDGQRELKEESELYQKGFEAGQESMRGAIKQIAEELNSL